MGKQIYVRVTRTADVPVEAEYGDTAADLQNRAEFPSDGFVEARVLLPSDHPDIPEADRTDPESPVEDAPDAEDDE